MKKTHNPEIEAYIHSFSDEDQFVLNQIRDTLLEVVADGFEEAMGYGMPGFVVPLSRYPRGYHTAPNQPLPYIGYARQKQHFSIYLMNLDINQEAFKKFEEVYREKYGKLDHGVGCLRFRKADKIPFEELKELIQPISVDDYIAFYEAAFALPRKKGA